MAKLFLVGLCTVIDIPALAGTICLYKD